MRGKHDKLGEGTCNKLGEGGRKVRLGQDSLPNSHFHTVEMALTSFSCIN